MAGVRLVGFALVEYFHKASTTLIGKLAARDPKTWTAAELREMYAEFTKISELVTDAEADWNKEQGEADAIQKKYDQRLRSVEILNAQLMAATDPGKKKALETSCGKQMTEVEGMLTEVEREKREAVSSKKVYDDMVTFCTNFKNQLLATQAEMEEAAREIKSAEMEQRNAQLRESIAQKAAGLQSSGDKVNTVLDAMRKVAADKQKEAAAANLRADLLHKTNLEEEDPLIAAAMAEASGQTPNETLSFADRIAKLKGATA